ncbi:MAG: hypothetical protein GX135_05330 [Candidatus Cloacimonetes bacterium]|nr:hypothetical protein [Candidatus Cloacimonadota bacterium]
MKKKILTLAKISAFTILAAGAIIGITAGIKALQNTANKRAHYLVDPKFYEQIEDAEGVVTQKHLDSLIKQGFAEKLKGEVPINRYPATHARANWLPLTYNTHRMNPGYYFNPFRWGKGYASNAPINLPNIPQNSSASSDSADESLQEPDDEKGETVPEKVTEAPKPQIIYKYREIGKQEEEKKESVSKADALLQTPAVKPEPQAGVQQQQESNLELAKKYMNAKNIQGDVNTLSPYMIDFYAESQRQKEAHK